jgi:RsiW-degrading membrane proteinase PrsW (M82 family)
VIRASQWGQDVRLFRARNFTAWVFGLLFLYGLLQWWSRTSDALAAFADALAFGTVAFLVYGLVLLWIIVRLDRYAAVPTGARVLAIVWGGLVATYGMAANYNNALRGILTKLGGAEFAETWHLALGPGFSEEVSKGLVVVLMMGLSTKLVRSAFDGFILGALSGLGFQIFENVVYSYQVAQSNFGEIQFSVINSVFRAVVGLAGHWMWSAIVGAGVVYLIGTAAESARRGRGLALIVTPMLLHALWDATGVFFGGSNLVLGAIMILTTIAFVWTYRQTVARERGWMRDLLAPEVAAGVLTADEADAAAGPRKTRRAFVKSADGHAARKAARHVVEAARDLADEIARAGGHDTDRVDHTRAEVARLRMS